MIKVKNVRLKVRFKTRTRIKNQPLSLKLSSKNCFSFYLKIIFGISFFSSVGSEVQSVNALVCFVSAPFCSWLANDEHATILDNN